MEVDPVIHPSQGKQTIVLVIVGVVIGLGIAGSVYYMTQNTKQTTYSQAATSIVTSPSPSQERSPAISTTWPDSDVRWENTSEGGWLALGTPPPCPEPVMFAPPTDIHKATSLLYPGQERRGEKFLGKGGNYKPHGGFRFDGLAYNDVQVTAPFNGYVYRGSRFLQDGELQYSFDLVNSCGFMVRLGHLRELSPQFQAIADAFPPAAEMDSRTERVTSYPKIKTGDLIATGVGFRNSKNISFDWGVYDLRKPNEASSNSTYKQNHADASELAYYAVCWLHMIPTDDATFLSGLPAGDPVSGKTSDYCK